MASRFLRLRIFVGLVATLFGFSAYAAFPQWSETTESNTEPAATSHLVAMPANVSADNLLIIWYSQASLGQTINTPTGWTSEISGSGNDQQYVIYSKKADGTEGGTTVDITSTSTIAAHQVFQVYDWDGTLATDLEFSTPINHGFVSGPDPGSLTPAWGAKDTLWITLWSGADDDIAVSTYPSTYINGVDTLGGGGGGASTEVGSATLESNTATEDPGAWAIVSSQQSVTVTLGIEPGASGSMPSSSNVPAILESMGIM